MLKLFYCPGHLSFAPHVILHEIGAPFEAVHLSIKDGDTRTDAFRHINPKGRVPVLDTGSGVITEAAAILFYLALTHPERALLPTSPLGITRAVEWTNWLGATLAWAVGQNVRPDRLTDEVDAHPGIRRKGNENITEIYGQIDGRLEGRPWALEEGYSIVDPMLTIFFKWGHLMTLDMERFPRWTAHTRRMEERPAVRRTLDVERISVWP